MNKRLLTMVVVILNAYRAYFSSNPYAEYVSELRIDGLQKGMNIVKVGGKTHKVLVK